MQESNVTLEAQKILTVSALCKNDNTLINYHITLVLEDLVNDWRTGLDILDKEQERSYYEKESVGRIYFNLTKSTKPSRWRKLIDRAAADDGSIKKGNIQVWWEIHEKYESDLVDHMPFEDDD